MSTAPAELRDRTKAFAIRIVKLYRLLPRTADSQVVGKQLLRCGTSVAANYRAACRGRSRAEWIAKIGLVVEEADETVFWLEMLSDCGIVPSKRCADILKEARELSAIQCNPARGEAGKLNYQITKLPDYKCPYDFWIQYRRKTRRHHLPRTERSA
jgi:four helix bundle protein